MPFVAIEGSDGAGKATQTALLAEALGNLGCTCEVLAFPAYGRTLGGRLLGDCLAGRLGDFVHLHPQLASLPYALDRFESRSRIKSALAQGRIVIADRYIGSNQIHQGGKIFAEKNQLSRLESYIEWLDKLEHGLLDNPKPDVTIYLKVPLETSLKLLHQKRAAKNSNLKDGALDQVESDRYYLENSIAMAGWLAQRFASWRTVECAETDGAMRAREAIHADVLKVVRPFLQKPA